MATPRNAAEEERNAHREPARCAAWLRLEDAEVTFPNGFCALRGVNLEVPSGQFVAIVGLSGSGKTTLIRSVGGLTPLSRGCVFLHGDRVSDRNRGKDFSYVFQDPVLLPWRTVLGNVMLPLEVFGVSGIVDRAREMINLVGLRDFSQAYPDELSGGMKARVAIARALTYEPKCLLMDEPFGELDEITRNRMNLELMRIWQATKTTTLFVTHSLSEAVFLAERILVLGSPPNGIVADIHNDDLGGPRDLRLLARPKFASRLADVRDALGEAGNGK